jgi:hypothetical protein
MFGVDINYPLLFLPKRAIKRKNANRQTALATYEPD